MKLKLFSLSIILAAALTCGPVYAEGPVKVGPDADDGRFQLFQGTYTTYDLKKQQTSTSTGIFLIDTRTGKVKRYLNKIDEQGKYIETWVPTDLPSEK